MKTRPERRHSAAGFTLIEVLAAVFLTAIVMAVALSFFVSLSRSTEAATNRTREGRRALAVVDRVARDLEGAYLLVKPPGLDPLAHPWLFLAESRFSGKGADRVKFVTRNHRPRNPYDHGSDLAVVTYLLRTSDGLEGYELLRAVSPRLPEGLDREFLSQDDELYMVVADGIEDFSMRFRGEGGDWASSWDSSLIEESSELPTAAEIEISYLADSEREDFGDFGEGGDLGDEGGTSYKRLVLFPMKAVDLASMLDQAQQVALQALEAEEAEDEDGEEGDEEDGDGEEVVGDGQTVADCLSPEDQDLIVDQLGEAILELPLSDPSIALTLQSYGIVCQ